MKVMKIMQDGGLIFCEQLQRDAKLHKKQQQIAKDFDKKYPTSSSVIYKLGIRAA